MTQQIRVAPQAQAAAFALVEALKRTEGVPLAPGSLLRLRLRGEVDPTARGLAPLGASGVALELELCADITHSRRQAWVCGGDFHGAPVVSCWFDRARPALTLRFDGRAFVAGEGGRWTLSERPVFPSSDPLHAQREAACRRLAQAWGVPVRGRRFEIGSWCEVEGAWQQDAPSRFIAIAWLLAAVRA
ncbi:MAG: hypothetical protein VKQ33_13295 [Candidatus Sericytochromatia bacterium]|nr:hypothetical protein [Candidatus Sericytochromatia bacterium]